MGQQWSSKEPSYSAQQMGPPEKVKFIPDSEGQHCRPSAGAPLAKWFREQTWVTHISPDHLYRIKASSPRTGTLNDGSPCSPHRAKCTTVVTAMIPRAHAKGLQDTLRKSLLWGLGPGHAHLSHYSCSQANHMTCQRRGHVPQQASRCQVYKLPEKSPSLFRNDACLLLCSHERTNRNLPERVQNKVKVAICL